MAWTHDPPTTAGDVPRSEPSAAQNRGGPPPTRGSNYRRLSGSNGSTRRWQEGLEKYARATNLAVALVDAEGVCSASVSILGRIVRVYTVWP
jgi:hypothetical protein